MTGLRQLFVQRHCLLLAASCLSLLRHLCLVRRRSQKTLPEAQIANSAPPVAFIDNIILLLLP